MHVTSGFEITKRLFQKLSVYYFWSKHCHRHVVYSVSSQQVVGDAFPAPLKPLDDSVVLARGIMVLPRQFYSFEEKLFCDVYFWPPNIATRV